MRLYLVRHGETFWNKERRLQGWLDSELTLRGEDQARALADYFSNIEFSKVYSSPIKRAYTTTKILIGNRGKEIQLLDDLREINLGEWEGISCDDFKAKSENDYDNFWNYPEKFKTKKGETFFDLQTRFIDGIKFIVQNSPDGNILIVSHGAAIRTFLTYIKGKKISEMWQVAHIAGTSFNVVDYYNEKYKVVSEANIPHLSENLTDINYKTR